MGIIHNIRVAVLNALQENYALQLPDDAVTINQTKQEFEGNYTVVLFPLVKKIKSSPEQIGEKLGSYLVQHHSNLFSSYNVIKGFLNLTVTDSYFINFLLKEKSRGSESSLSKVVVEYSSPNTNKPLHLGHLRNNFLGWSVAEILKATGNHVAKTCIVNDRGIHICKSMIAWQMFGNGETPDTTATKGDHFVGDYYVKCENQIRKEAAEIAGRVNEKDYSDIAESQQQKLIEIDELLSAIIGENDRDKEKIAKYNDDRKEIIRANTPIMKKAQEMLVKWEAGDEEVLSLWRQMNGWVYEGFDQTYKRIGTDFDKVYYESETYLLGKQFVQKGIEDKVFYQEEDGSVWIDLTEEGLDEKLVLRKDGTSVYITQDLGLADEKYTDFQYNKSVYVIADEQNYHMQVLEATLKKLKKPYADGILHLSYGMVELPSGRMKSREGTVVDADDMVDEMVQVAATYSKESGKLNDFNEFELNALYETIALGAIKFYLLRVDPKKRMIFNPEESIDFQGFTGPFIQYTHARIKSILRKADYAGIVKGEINFILPLTKLEKELILQLEQFDNVVNQAASELNPSVIAIYTFQLARTYNTFYSEHSVLRAENEEKKLLRIKISDATAATIKSAMHLLGIRVPEMM